MFPNLVLSISLSDVITLPPMVRLLCKQMKRMINLSQIEIPLRNTPFLMDVAGYML